MAAARDPRLLQLPRRSRQQLAPEYLPQGSRSGLAACPAAARSAWSNALVQVHAICRTLRPAGSDTSSVPESALPVMTRLQEPYAVVPHVRICAGGGEQSPSLPRSALVRRCIERRFTA